MNYPVYGRFSIRHYLTEILSVLVFWCAAILILVLPDKLTSGHLLLAFLSAVIGIIQIIRICLTAASHFSVRENGFYRGKKCLFTYAEVQAIVISRMEKPYQLVHDPMTVDLRIFRNGHQPMMSVSVLRCGEPKNILKTIHSIYANAPAWKFSYTNEKIRSALGKNVLFDFTYDAAVFEYLMRNAPSAAVIVQQSMLSQFARTGYPGNVTVDLETASDDTISEE